MKAFFLHLLLLALASLSSPNYYGVKAKCDFLAVFNFGDSNSDTGGFWAAFPSQPSPFGSTYFGHPVGRASDGRLVVDFLSNVD
jgi:hypothetical protein